MANRVKKRTLFYYQGDTFNHVRIEYLDEFQQPVDLTGFTARMDIKEAVGGAAVVALSIGNGLLIDAPATGIIQTNASPALMAPLVPGTTYYYDIQITDGGTVVETVLAGQFLVDSQITE